MAENMLMENLSRSKKCLVIKKKYQLCLIYIFMSLLNILSHEVPVSKFRHTLNTRRKINFCLPSHNSTQEHSHPYYM